MLGVKKQNDQKQKIFQLDVESEESRQENKLLQNMLPSMTYLFLSWQTPNAEISLHNPLPDARRIFWASRSCPK